MKLPPTGATYGAWRGGILSAAQYHDETIERSVVARGVCAAAQVECVYTESERDWLSSQRGGVPEDP